MLKEQKFRFRQSGKKEFVINANNFYTRELIVKLECNQEKEEALTFQ